MWTLSDDRGNRYEVDDTPARVGGQADIYAARIEGAATRVAAKVGRTASDQAALLAERALLHDLGAHHAVGQHIPPLLGGGITEDGRAFLILEWFDQTAEEWIRDRGLGERLQVATRICEAVVILHAAGDERFYVHRDIKPKNVLVKADEDGLLRVVLADFGIARATSLCPTMTTSALGTDGYMAPEQAMPGERKATKAWDCYALACTVYYCITEHAPFSARTDARRIARSPALNEPSSYYDFTRMPALSEQDVADLDRAIRETERDDERATVIAAFVLEGLRSALNADPAGRGTALDLLGWMQRAHAIAGGGVAPQIAAPIKGHFSFVVAIMVLLALLAGGIGGLKMHGMIWRPIGLPDCSSDKGKTCFKLGMDYKLGRGVSKGRVDERLALLYFQSACDAKDYDACTWLGSLHDNGEAGLFADPVIGAAYHRRACNQNNGDGCNRLAYMFDKGLGVPEDPEAAVRYFEKSCEKEFGLGCANVGHFYEGGRGVTKDLNKAMEFYRLACDLGEQNGCVSREDLLLRMKESSE